MKNVFVYAFVLVLVLPLAASLGVSPPEITFTEQNQQADLLVTITGTITYKSMYVHHSGTWHEIALNNNRTINNWVVGDLQTVVSIDEEEVRNQEKVHIASYSCNWDGEWLCPDTWDIVVIPIQSEIDSEPSTPVDRNLTNEILPNSKIITTEHGDIYFAEIARNLKRPWALEQLPDGRLLVNSWHGTMHIVGLDGSISEPLSNVPRVINERQAGLLDVALHPDFEQNNWVYITYSGIQEVDGQEKYMTHLARAKLINDDLQQVEVLFRGQPPTYSTRPRHFGSRITFDANNDVYFGIGDRRSAGRAQNLNDHAGTIIRLHDDGSIPEDNPFMGQANILPEIYAYGVRNPQGIATHPTTGDIWENEHGPEGGDEVNIIVAGANYGWPLYTEGVNYGGAPIGAETPPEDTIRAIHWWVPSIAPSSMTFYTGNKLSEWKGNVFVSALTNEERGRRIARLEVTESDVTHEEQFLINEVGRIRDVREGNDEYIYLATDGGYIYRLGPFVQDTQ